MLSTDLMERQLLDALPVSIYALDIEGRLTSVHQAATRFSEDGASGPIVGNEGHGTAIWDAMPDRMSRSQVEHAMHLLRTGRSSVVRWESRAADDHHVALTQMTPLHDDAHAVTGFVISTSDITSLVRARDAAVSSALALARTTDPEHAFHEAAFQLRQTLRADLIIVAVCDDASTTPRIAYDYGSDGDRHALEHRFATAWQSVMAGQSLVTTHADAVIALSAALPGKTGTLGALTVVADEIESPEGLADAGRFLATVASQLAAAIERARYAAHDARKHRGAAIGEVATGVAQELRNPIFGISSAAQLLRFRAREDPVMEKNVGRILREVERLNRMVGTLAELGRPIALKLSSIDPDAVWDDVLESERGRLESRAVAIHRTRPESPTLIDVDAEQISHVFRSILSNAVDAAPEASDISLESVVLPNGGWRCRLTNGGAPIPAEMLPRVFELFLSTKPGSSGVGLALTRRIIDEHNGSISIESTAAAGTTVSVTLPSTPRIASLP
jgi:signal transduction histidine kinase